MSVKELRAHTLEEHERQPVGLEEQTRSKEEVTGCSCGKCNFTCFTKQFMFAHNQMYHFDPTSEDSLASPAMPVLVTCPMCKMIFKTNCLLASHCIRSHGIPSWNATITQTSFPSWAQFEPWLENMESSTGSTMIKSGAHAFGKKLIHSYNCQYDMNVIDMSKVKEEQKISKNCPAFVKVVENEDGILDCVGFFTHIGHDSAFSDAYSPSTDNVDVCYICGSSLPPEVDAVVPQRVKWVRCVEKECRSLAHTCCVQLLGWKCIKCKNGTLTEAVD